MTTPKDIARTRERRHAPARARRCQHVFDFGGADLEAITLGVSWVGEGVPDSPTAEQRRRWCYRGLERVLMFRYDQSAFSRVGTPIWLNCSC